MKAKYIRHILNFKRPGGTSRGVLHQKETFYLLIEKGEKFGIGECGLLRGLSIDDRPDYEEKLQWVCDHISESKETLLEELRDFPSIQIGLETALISLNSRDPFEIFPSGFVRGTEAIPINGLVWMGDYQFMKEQISQKLEEGFSCIKMKIGAIDFEKELSLLKSIRKDFSASQIVLRVDANGAFHFEEAKEKLKILSELDLHSIEQPIKAGQWQEMAELCNETALPIALDEELIGVTKKGKKKELLETIKPQYIILKPSLVGGFHGTDQWISLAEDQGTGWWITSALESNIGLNAIAQYTFSKGVKMEQGLGTGSLYTNNIDSPLEVSDGILSYRADGKWNLKEII